MNKERHQHEVVYSYCMRCGWRFPLSAMDWRGGILVCHYQCWDYMILGERDAMIARALTQPTQELQPDPKLTNNASSGLIDEILI